MLAGRICGAGVSPARFHRRRRSAAKIRLRLRVRRDRSGRTTRWFSVGTWVRCGRSSLTRRAKSFSPHGFDIIDTTNHHGRVRVSAKVLLVTAAAFLMTWHGIILSLPHDHADAGIPQEELACSASHPLSSTFHLHGAGEVLTPHHCLACLAGSNHASAPVTVALGSVISEYVQPAVAVADCRSKFRVHLPVQRGPPANV